MEFYCLVKGLTILNIFLGRNVMSMKWEIPVSPITASIDIEGRGPILIHFTAAVLRIIIFKRCMIN